MVVDVELEPISLDGDIFTKVGNGFLEQIFNRF